MPTDERRLAQDCYEAYNIQVAGLEQRLRAIGNPKVVIGVSGGLDSTHALIVAARAMDRLDRPRTDILAFTLPGFATGERTRTNAERLAASLGVTFETIDITDTARLMLDNLDHPFADGEPVYDVTFENVQAGLRTDYLFRAANQRGGIVLGTGDLSELALGWCTYGVGDQMSHYNVNGGVPKTLIQHLIRWVVAERLFSDEVGVVLTDVLGTEITPELVPAGADGEVQSSQAVIGPYSLQDFHLFHVLRHGFRPSKVAFLAWHAWHDAAPGEWPPGFPDDERACVHRSPRSATGWRCSSAASSASPSSSARPCPTARRWSPAARCRHAATGGRRRTSPPPSGSTSCTPTSPSSAHPHESSMTVPAGGALLPEHTRGTRLRRARSLTSDRAESVCSVVNPGA